MKVAPIRSCIGCRQPRPKEELLRYVLSPDGAVVPDLKNRLPGRGAYTCRSRQCLINAVERKQFSRAFKGVTTVVDVETVLKLVVERLEESIAGSISLANKAGKVVSGTEAVLSALREGNVALVILAEDVSEDTAARIRGLAHRSKTEVISFFTKEKLADLLGKELRSAVVLRACGFVKGIINDFETFRNFHEGGAQ